MACMSWSMHVSRSVVRVVNGEKRRFDTRIYIQGFVSWQSSLEIMLGLLMIFLGIMHFVFSRWVRVQPIAWAVMIGMLHQDLQLSGWVHIVSHSQFVNMKGV